MSAVCLYFIFLGTEQGQVSVWNPNGKLHSSWQAHTSCGVNAVQMSPDLNLVLSGAGEVCVYSLSGETAQLTCWNMSEVTALEWIDHENFLVAETSGMITHDRVNKKNFRKVTHYMNNFTIFFYIKKFREIVA